MGLAIKPATYVECLVKYADIVDTLLIMTVEPGFGGQKFMHDMMPKVCGCAVDVVDVYSIYKTRQMPFNNVYYPISGLRCAHVESGTFSGVWFGWKRLLIPVVTHLDHIRVFTVNIKPDSSAVQTQACNLAARKEDLEITRKQSSLCYVVLNTNAVLIYCQLTKL